jgi:hypothetical protein
MLLQVDLHAADIDRRQAMRLRFRYESSGRLPAVWIKWRAVDVKGPGPGCRAPGSDIQAPRFDQGNSQKQMRRYSETTLCLENRSDAPVTIGIPLPNLGGTREIHA